MEIYDKQKNVRKEKIEYKTLDLNKCLNSNRTNSQTSLNVYMRPNLYTITISPMPHEIHYTRYI